MLAIDRKQFLRGSLLVGVFTSFLGIYVSVSLIGAGVLLSLVSGFLIIWKEPNFLREHPLFSPTLLLSLAIGMSILFANPYAFGKPLEKVGYLLSLFPFTVCFVLFPKSKNHLRHLALFLSFILFALAMGQSLGLLVSAPSFLNKHLKPLPHSEGLFLATGFTFHHTPFGASLTWLFHLNLAQSLLQTRRKMRVLYFFGALASFLGASASLSRGVWLSLTLSCFFVLLLVSWRKTLFALGIAFLLSLLVLPRFPDLQTRVRSISFGANPERIELWKISWEMFLDAPLLGQGYHSFGARLDKFRTAEQLYPGFPREAHNMYLDFLSSTGLLGFISFLVFLGSAVSYLWRSWKNLKSVEDRTWILCVVGGFGAFLIAGFFDRHFYMTQTLTALLLFLSIACSFHLRGLKKSPEFQNLL